MSGPTAAPALEVSDVTVRFGGLTAVDGVSLRCEPGVATGLIGPNGAGKTTTFNAATGFVKPTTGSVRLGDNVLDRIGPEGRAQAGLGRTFQRMELFDTMTVAENVAMGPEMVLAGRRPWTHVVPRKGQRAATRAAAADAIEQCGLVRLADRYVNDLSTGQRRLVELARAIASRFRFLLLDEPSSGLDDHETQQFIRILEELVEDTGIGVLLVEHDMTLVRALCRYIYVLDFGKLIYHGPTADVLASEVVQAAYLGSEAVDSETA